MHSSVNSRWRNWIYTEKTIALTVLSTAGALNLVLTVSTATDMGAEAALEVGDIFRNVAT